MPLTTARSALRLNRRDRDNADDVVGGAAAGKIVDRCRDALADRTVSFRLCKALHEFVADIACVKVGEDQDVRLASDRGCGRLLLMDLFLKDLKKKFH